MTAEEPDDALSGFRVLSGDPTPDELAAVTAVIAALIEEQGDDARRRARRGQSAWQRSQRGLRTPLTPGPGVWRSFSA